MYIFWENVFRFPRFFITSVSGLIVILLTPFLKLALKDMLIEFKEVLGRAKFNKAYPSTP